MPATGPWRKADVSDFWHFCVNCPFYPDDPGAETSYERPTSGWICITCRRRLAAGDCA